MDRIKRGQIAIVLVLAIFTLSFIFGTSTNHDKITARVSQSIAENVPESYIENTLIVLLIGFVFVLTLIIGTLLKRHHTDEIQQTEEEPQQDKEIKELETFHELMHEKQELMEKLKELKAQIEETNQISNNIVSTRTSQHHLNLVNEHAKAKMNQVRKEIDAVNAFTRTLQLRKHLNER